MPLNPEQQRQLNVLHGLSDEFQKEVQQYPDHIRRAEVLKKFDTRGKRLDLAQLSMEELQDMFDVGSNLSATNEVDTVNNQHVENGKKRPLNFQYGSDYLVGKAISSSRGPDSKPANKETNEDEVVVPASREYMEAAVGEWMKSLNHAANPRELIQAEATVRDSPAGNIGNRRNALAEKYEALQESVRQETGEEFHDEAIEQSIRNLKAAEQAYDEQAKVFKEEAMKRAPIEGVEFAAQMKLSAREVAFEILESSSLDRNAKANLSGANIKGLDLSQSDLSNVQIDAQSLSRANGLDSVKGVDPLLLAEAKAIKPHVARVDELKERQAKLENKGGNFISNLRNIRRGGVDGELKHIEKELEKAEQGIASARVGARSAFAAEVDNEFEQRSTYGIGKELTVAEESEEDIKAKKNQASETYKANSAHVLDDRGTKSAIGKKGAGDKTAELQAKARSLQENIPHDEEEKKVRARLIDTIDEELQSSAAKDMNLYATASPLYGTQNAVAQAPGGRDMVDEATNRKLALGGNPTSLLTRAVATSTVNKALEMDAVAEEKFAVDAKGKASTLSVLVPGAPILTRPTKDNPQECYLDVDYSDPDIQKGLYDLEAQDYICGQIDRHTGNIFVDPHSKEVRGIDNDLAFPVVSREEMLKDGGVQAKAAPGKPMFMHEDTARKIEALNPEDLRAQLMAIQTPEGVAALEPEAVDGAVERLKELQTHVKDLRKQGRVVTEFNKQTYQAAYEEQVQRAPGKTLYSPQGIVPPASYLGAAIADGQKTKAINELQPKEQHRKVITDKDVEVHEVDPKFAAYKQGVEDAKGMVAANPELLSDAELAKQIKEGQARLGSLDLQLQALDKNVGDAEARFNEARKSGDAVSIAEFGEALDHAQQERQEVLQQVKAEQKKMNDALDLAVLPQKKEIATRARLAEPQVKVQQPRAQVMGEVKLDAKEDVKLEAEEVKNEEPEEEIKLDRSVDIPLTESQIMDIENEFASLENQNGPIEIEDDDGITITEVSSGVENNVAELDAQKPEVPLTPVQQMSAAAIADLAADKSGKQVFEMIENSGLAPAQKQQVFLAVAENVVEEGCRNAREGEGALRSNTSGTQFMSAYMNAYAREYVDAVGQQSLEAIQNIQLPAEGYSRKGGDAALSPDNVPKPGFVSDEEDSMGPELCQQWDDVYFQAGMAAVNASESQLPKLSPEAQAFLKSCGDTVRRVTPAANADNVAMMVMANTVSLRGSLQNSASDGSNLQVAGDTAEKKIHGRLLTNASIIAQSYVNNLPRSQQLGSEKQQNKIVNMLREDGLNNSRAVMKGLSQGQIPNTPENELAPPDATQTLNAAIPGREQRLRTGEGPRPVALAAPNAQGTSNLEPPALRAEGKKSRFASVRDAIMGAPGKIVDSAKAKLDQAKLNRLEKQYEKRAAHQQVLTDRKQFAASITGMSKEDKQLKLAELRREENPGKLLNPKNAQEFARQKQIADQIEMCKMSPEQLGRLSAKLDQRIEQNVQKKTSLGAQKDAQKAKVDLRQRQAQGQNQGRGHGAQV